MPWLRRDSASVPIVGLKEALGVICRNAGVQPLGHLFKYTTGTVLGTGQRKRVIRVYSRRVPNVQVCSPVVPRGAR